MLKRILVVASFLAFSIGFAAAQQGTVKGNVKDAQSGEGIVGANVYIEGTTNGTAADINGDFEIPHVKTGKINLIISFISYKSDTLKNLTVYPDQTTLVNTVLVEESQQLSEVVVSGMREKNTDISVISDIKTSQLVVAGISAQQISMSQDRDAAQIVRRIPGITIVGNKFVNVRGLSERYNTVLINGVIAPSTEVDSRAFAFDLIPSSMIDRMMVYKSGSPEFSGEFAGAVINIETKSVVDQNSLSVNVTGGYRAGTTFENFETYKGGKTDWLGVDDGSRNLPSEIPSQNLRGLSVANEEYTSISQSLPNNWGTISKTAAPDLRTTINLSQSGYVGKHRLSNISSLSYTNVRQSFGQSNDYYLTGATGVDQQFKIEDQRFQESVRVGLISNFIFEIDPSNKIEFRNLFNQQGVSEVTERQGQTLFNDNDLIDRALNYTSRSLYTGQLSGKHSLNDQFNLNWIFGYSHIGSHQPDYRNISKRKNFVDDEFAIVIPPNASIQDGGRFFGDLKEDVFTHALNIDYKLNPEADDKQQSKISFGYYLASTDRDFHARWFSYGGRPGLTGTGLTDLLRTSDFTNIFIKQNIGTNNEVPGDKPPYFILNEGTNPSDRYQGKNLLTAGYGNISFPFGERYRLAAGIRIEYNHQQLLAKATNGIDDANTDNPVTSVLPLTNLTYNFSERSLLRFAYSKTVNRPVFRELADFNYYDFNRRANVFGNPNLKTADIHNADLRWETYPSAGQSISAGLFYKYFLNPIEQRLYPGNNLIYSFANANTGRSYGVEVEVRKSLQPISQSKFFSDLNLVLNAAYIRSEVTYGDEIDNQEKNRAMQGQSPYIVNAGLYYNNFENGLQVNVSYNVFGPRIYAVGDGDQVATQYELPRHQLDLTFSKALGEKFELKLGVQDILNQKYRIYQDSNKDKKIDTTTDDAIQVYRLGQYVTLGFTYKIK